MWEIIWLRPPHPGHTMMNSWDEVLICQTIVISPQLLRSAVVPRVGVAKAKQRLMTQLSRNLLWKLSVEQLKLNGNWSQSKELPQNWDESEIRQLKKRRLQAQFECLSSKAWPLRVLQFWRPSSPSFPQLQLALELKSVWQIVCDIMIMLMTLVMSCNCCAWSVPRFSSRRAPWTDYT